MDFLDIKFFRIFIFDNIHDNYVFNFADICILSGVVMLVYVILTGKNHKTDELIPKLIEDREEKV